MTLNPETWESTSQGVQQIVADIDAGKLSSTPERRNFLAGIAKGLRSADAEAAPAPLPTLCESSLNALRDQVYDVREKVNSGSLPMSDGDREYLNRYANQLDELHISGGYPVDHPCSDLDGGCEGPASRDFPQVGPETVGLADLENASVDGGSPDSADTPETTIDGGTL
ncbi:hypothetical protein ACLRGI_10290 [Paenarthrobacter nitroguajacolicus]|uniref:hypothetical protein n=1 Tax=Paenarthrobacter nitroguajacolicus TaxID=211146 RepID=UPI003ADA49E7